MHYYNGFVEIDNAVRFGYFQNTQSLVFGSTASVVLPTVRVVRIAAPVAALVPR